MSTMTSIAGNPIAAEECEICLSSLSIYDKTHPLLCPVSSGSNICFNCMSHLVKMKESSDRNNKFNSSNSGSNNVVKTLCPRCQNDISHTIEDTFLMRKAMKMQSSTGNVPDSELSAAELRFKYSITPQQIEECKERIEKFQQDIAQGNGVQKEEYGRSSATTRINNSPARTSKISPPNSKHGDNSSSSSSSNNETKMTFTAFHIMKSIKFDLFQGIRDMLSEAEQTFIFELMTSGDVDKLVQACQILSELRRIHQPLSNPSNSMDYADISTTSSSSIHKQLKTKYKSDAEIRALRMSMSNEERNKVEEVEQYLDWNPLPRLPKFITLEANFDVYAKHGKVLKFRDDGWDGSVSDAFTRAYSVNNTTNESFESEEDGFVNDNRGQKSTKKLRDNRVLVYAARKQAAAVGISVGDVVTHVDGNEFLGTANELRELIHGLYSQGNQMFTMVVNAEQMTADALKDFAVELNR